MIIGLVSFVYSHGYNHITLAVGRFWFEQISIPKDLRTLIVYIGVMTIMEIFRTIKLKNFYALQSWLVISVISAIAWISISALSKKKIRREQHRNDKTSRPIPLIVITGCDTGLGYSIVMRYLNDGPWNENPNANRVCNFSVLSSKQLVIPAKIAIVAFCLNPDGPGAKRLHQLSVENSKIILFLRQLDLTDKDSIETGANFVLDLLQRNIDETDCFKYALHAVVNNAARMVMAEYEWQTTQMIQQQFNVNILGPIVLTAHLLPKLRQNKSRVINVISHCAYLPLPGLSIYGATKAAIRAWTIGSRVELETHGMRWITFSPGSFFLYSSIMSGQQRMDDFKRMNEHMSQEQLAYYGSYFDAYQGYLSSIDAYIQPPETTIPSTNQVYSLMDNALWMSKPKSEYNVTEPRRYRIYYTLAWMLSAFGLHNARDTVVRRFVATPQFQNYITKQKELVESNSETNINKSSNEISNN